MTDVKRGDIWLADLKDRDNSSSIQGSIRPVVIISNEACNKFSPVITVVPITSRCKNNLPTHVKLYTDTGLYQESIVLAEQIMPLDKVDLLKRIGNCSANKLNEIERAVKIQNGMIDANLDIAKLNNFIEEIQKIDGLIEKCKIRKLDYYDEMIERSFLLAEFISYCKQNYIDYERIMINKGINSPNTRKHVREVI